MTFATAPPADPVARSAVKSLEYQQTAFRYALFVRPGDTRYLARTGLNMAGAFASIARQVRAGHIAERGVVRYGNITPTVTSYSWGTGALITFCLDTSAAEDYSTLTGRPVAAVVPGGSYTYGLHKQGPNWQVSLVQKGGAPGCPR